MDQTLTELRLMSTAEFWHAFLEANGAPLGAELAEATIPAMKSLRPRFSSSSFFDRSRHPTVEEQVTLCRQIARQLVCDELNDCSKGRRMFEQRVERSHSWTTADGEDDDSGPPHPIAAGECTYASALTQAFAEPNLRLLLDPRHVQDISSMGFDTNESASDENQRKSATREIVASLSGVSRGGALYQERRSQSEEWVTVNETNEIKESVNDTFRKYRDFNARPKPFRRIE